MRSFKKLQKPLLLLFLLCSLPLGALAQSIVKGTVIDEAGEPIIGASVKVQGTNTGAVTDFNGEFSVPAASNATLEISFVGYVTELVSVQGRNDISVTMREDATTLEDVVVIGHGRLAAAKRLKLDEVPCIRADKLSEAQIKATTDVFVNAEIWMDEPATGIVDFGLKTVAKAGYSLVNEPIKLLTGYSLAGAEATPSEMAEAFVGSVAGSMGVPLKKGMGTIKTVGKTGLGKYNDFVHKMGNYQGKTKREMGRLYQNNKELNNAVSTYDNFEKGISGTSAFRKEE